MLEMRLAQRFNPDTPPPSPELAQPATVVTDINERIRLEIERTTTRAQTEAARIELPSKCVHLERLANDSGCHQVFVDHAKSRLQESFHGLLSRGIDRRVPVENPIYPSYAYVDAHGLALTEEAKTDTEEAMESYHA
jgi:hypothetical protein